MLSVLVAFAAERSALAATFTVTSTGDQGDNNIGNGICSIGPPTNVCTLRAALQEANFTVIADTIEFNILPAGSKTIAPASLLPTITRPVTIDGTTQPGWVAAPIIELDLTAAGANGLTLNLASSSFSTIRGLVLNRSPGNAIRILGGSTNNLIVGNYLGVDLTGTLARANAVGVFVQTSDNRIGGTAGDRNIISGNTIDGIQINGGVGGAANTVVENNYIGVDVTGTLPLGNGSQGVAVFGTNTNTLIGGTAPASMNVISGNGNDGILIATAGTTGTLVQGNRIGTNAAGTAAIPNLRGIEISGGSSGNVIGGPPGSQNVISGNTSHGILIIGSNANTVSRALIGLNAAGNAKIANGQQGVELSGGASSNTIGGVTGTGNVISGNGLSGVNIIGVGTSANNVLGNLIGLDLAGGAILSNSQFGVAIAQGATANTIGNATGGNVISGNDQGGVRIVDNGTNSNLVQSNLIGLDSTGALARPNLAEGVILDTAGAATGNRIGGVGFRNVISGNGTVGIRIRNGMTGTLVVDNYIGRNSTDTGSVPNGAGGVRIESSSGNTIGGTGANDGNVIAGNNGSDGVAVVGTATGNAILRNSIHSNAGLGIDLLDDGVTQNDPGDGDSGANNRQNFPALSAAMTNGAGSANFAGALNSAASTLYRIEFFASAAADPSGFGEGQRFLGTTNVTTNAAGNAIIGVTLATALTAGEFVTATATDPSNNTSEFSSAITAVGSLVVTTTANTVDGTTTSIANLIAAPGADGRISLHEAILAANATAGTDTIRFGIPLSDVNHLYYQDDTIPNSLSLVTATALPDADITNFDPDYPGVGFSWFRITPTATLPAITGSTVIDGYTQPGASQNTLALGNDAVPKIELDGSATAEGVNGLTINAINSTVQGLVINRFTDYGIRVGSAGAVIRGNFVGTNVTGTAPLGNNRLGNATGGGIAFFAGGATIGGTAPSARNLVSGNAAGCARGIEFWESSGNTIQGNYVGTNRSGTAAIANGCGGLVLDGTPGVGSDNNVVGGTAAGAGNVFSGNVVEGIFAQIGSDTNTIEGNIIGLNAAGTASIPNGAQGIKLFSAGNRVGGTAAGAGNVISGNTSQGVRIEGATSIGNTIIGNRIYNNGSPPTALGIDLLGDGITPNDVNDADSGPNNLLNFPFVTAALESGGVLTAYFKLDVPAGSYRIEFFKNPSGADPSGNGEGENFASSVNVTHPGGGSQNFSHPFAGVVGDIITATTTFCTDGATCATFGSTSEFSGAVTAVTTAVSLISFEAIPGDGAIDLHWRTGSELRNLGFHLYRSGSASGPYDRITDAVIPGLGSSPVGASYRHTDAGLTNGTRYFYKLEDIETTGRRELHGPVSAVPEAVDDDDDDGRTAYGDPGDVSLRVLERSSKGVLVELVTGGFFASPNADGTVRLEIPGFDQMSGAGSLALPVKRTWLEVVAGRTASIVSVEGFEETSLGGIHLASAGSPSVVASREGTVRAGSRRARHAIPSPGVNPAFAARIVETGFQGDVKKALLELAPLRWDGARGQLLWTRRLQIRLSFAGVEPSERTTRGTRGRRTRDENGQHSRTVLTHLATSKPGLYRVTLADVVGSRRASIALPSLRLSHRGEPHPFHLESKVLYFLGEEESVYELELAPGGRTMPVLDGSPAGPPVSSYLRRVEWEENRYYQAGLLDAPSLWFWDVLVSPSSKSYPFSLSAMLPEEGNLQVFLQGASDFEGSDHRVRVSINGIPVGEALWNGKAPTKLEASLSPGVLREGGNELSIDSVGDASVPYSMVFLDRFAVTYRRLPIAEAGMLEGGFTDSGSVAVDALSPGSIVVQTSPETAWIRGANGPSFRVEPGRSYLAVSPESVLHATLRRATASGLKDPRNRSDYLLIGPRDFLSAAEPLLRHRREQGLIARAVAIEDVYDEFGFGEASAEALKKFLEYAYHDWTGPAPRYVVLFGDATYDRKDYLKTGVRDRVPALMLKTSYLWTASDPRYAAVNGEDGLPDLALGRLPAASVEEARVLVAKVIEYEESGQSLSGRAVLVADNPDAAGDFEADIDEIASALSGREVEKIHLRTLGPEATRRAIVESFDRGASLLSYVGHGGIALWASENVFEGKDVSSLSPQARQPIVMTMNCLNGYFHFPYFDALGEALVKAPEKGAIAAFSPSGLSLDTPAHVYHQALVAELTSGRHQRLGDAVLAAQATYAESGFFPELLAIYNLLGDPALLLRR